MHRIHLVLFWAVVLCSVTTDADSIAAGSTGSIQLPINQVKLYYGGSDAPTSYKWSVESGVGPVSIANPTANETMVAMIEPGEYTFTLTLTIATKDNVELSTVVNLLANPWTPSDSSTGLDYLKNSLAGVYRDGHTMPPLTGMISHGIPLLLELADRWGFGLDLAIYPAYCTGDISGASGPPDYSAGHNTEALAIAVAGNGRYKTVAQFAAALPGYARSGGKWLEDAAASGQTIPESVWLHDSDGNRLGSNDNPDMSPLAPLDWVRSVARPIGECAAALSKTYPLSFITSNGEYGLGVVGWLGCSYLKDPELISAIGFPGQLDPYCWKNSSYVNETRNEALTRKVSQTAAMHERIIFEEATKNVTWRNDEVFYGLYTNSYGSDRGRWNGWAAWQRDYEDFIKIGVSTIPQPQIYFHDGNGGWAGLDQLYNPADMTWKMLNEVGGQIRFGQKNFYAWICVGGHSLASFLIAEQDRWTGFLKIMFTSGGLGGASGYFVYNGTYEGQAVRNQPMGTALHPWLRQYMDISRAQALFSHLEDYLREGDLVAGSYIHPFNVLTEPIPLYCLDIVGEPQGPNISPGVYVLARKMPNANKWLLTAWAQQGNDREVVAVLPGCGNLTVNARVAGTVYLVSKNNGQVSMRVLDPDPMHPSALMFSTPGALDTMAIEADPVKPPGYVAPVPIITPNSNQNVPDTTIGPSYIPPGSVGRSESSTTAQVSAVVLAINVLLLLAF